MGVETYEITISGSLSGQFVQNIFHCAGDNTAGTNLFSVADAILRKLDVTAGMLAKWCDCMPTTYVITSVRCRAILPVGGPTQIFLNGQLSNNAGTRAGVQSVSSSSPMFIWITGLRPSKTGRTFLPGVSESDIDENTLGGSLLSAMTLFGALWIATWTTTSPAYVFNGGVYRRALATMDDIQNYRISPIIGTQRRRQRPI
jgi:hypothetical protein